MIQHIKKYIWTGRLSADGGIEEVHLVRGQRLLNLVPKKLISLCG